MSSANIEFKTCTITEKWRTFRAHVIILRGVTQLKSKVESFQLNHCMDGNSESAPNDFITAKA